MGIGFMAPKTPCAGSFIPVTVANARTAFTSGESSTLAFCGFSHSGVVSLMIGPGIYDSTKNVTTAPVLLLCR